MQSPSTLSLSKGSTLNGKQGRPPNVLLIQGETILDLIPNPSNPWLNSFPSFPYALDNKRAMYDQRLLDDEEGVKANPFPCRPIHGKSERNGMSNQNLSGFITSDGTNNPFGTKREALLLCGKKA